MKSVLRFIALCALVLLSVFGFAGCQSGPKHEYTNGVATIEDARKQEADGKPDVAFDEYIDVKNASGNDREKAASAMLLAAQLASDNSRFGIYAGKKPGDANLPADVRKAIDERQTQGEQKAHETYKELLKDFAGTKAAQTAKDQKLQENLELQIDNRNKHQWSYKLVDGLVAMTGSRPAFSYWFALLLIAAIVKGITFPLTLRMYKSQREMQRLQPAIKALQEKHKDDQAELQKKTMEFYKEHGVNPLASCLPMLIQFPFMIWIYNTIRLYEFHFSHGMFLWVNPTVARLSPEYLAANMGQFDFPLLCLYTLSMYLTMKLTPATDPQAAAQQKQMSVMTTGMMFFFFIRYRWSAAFVFYWLILNIVSAAQSYYFVYRPNKLNPVTPIVLPVSADDKKRDSGNGAVRSLSTAPAKSGDAETTRPRRTRKPRR